MAVKKNVGYSPEDSKNSCAKYYDETIVDIAPHVQDALEHAPLPADTSPPFSEVTYLENESYLDLETGYIAETDGSIYEAILIHLKRYRST